MQVEVFGDARARLSLIEEAAEVALQTIRDASGDLQSVRLVRFVLFGENDLEAHERALARSA